MADQKMSEHILSITAAHDDIDYALVRAIAQGDAQALDKLYARHGPGLLAYLTGRLGERQLAEEVLQDVMLAVWKGAGRFRGESKVRTWLLSIARYRAINAQRRRRLPQVTLDETIPVQGENEPQQVLEQSTKQEYLNRAMAHLPAEQRETLELIFYHGLSGPEAASIQGISVGTVKSRLHRAKKALRKWLHMEESTHA